MALLDFKSQQPLLVFQNGEVMPRFLFDERLDERFNLAAIELPIGETGAQKSARLAADFLADLHDASWRAASSCSRR